LSNRQRAKKGRQAGGKATRDQIPEREDRLDTDVVSERSKVLSKKGGREHRAVPRAAKVAGVSERTVRDWLSRIDKDAKEARNKRIFNLWLACWQNTEIANEVSLSAPQITEIVSNFGIGNLARTEGVHAEHVRGGPGL
jgi:hypothetical protein